jgi:hypothetical protein
MSINDYGKGKKVTINLPTQRHIYLLWKVVCLFLLVTLTSPKPWRTPCRALGTIGKPSIMSTSALIEFASV